MKIAAYNIKVKDLFHNGNAVILRWTCDDEKL
jgi:hypothetical protein